MMPRVQVANKLHEGRARAIVQPGMYFQILKIPPYPVAEDVPAKLSINRKRKLCFFSHCA